MERYWTAQGGDGKGRCEKGAGGRGGGGGVERKHHGRGVESVERGGGGEVREGAMVNATAEGVSSTA